MLISDSLSYIDDSIRREIHVAFMAYTRNLGRLRRAKLMPCDARLARNSGLNRVVAVTRQSVSMSRHSEALLATSRLRNALQAQECDPSFSVE